MTRLYRQVARQIAALIDSGEFKVAERLPAERHLSTRLSVSRPTIREAIIALELSGLVEVRAGSGVYVIDPPLATNLALKPVESAGASPLDVINARLKIECALMADAAKNASSNDIEMIAAAVDEMESSPLRPRIESADQEFHVLIASATGNSVLKHIVKSLWIEMASPIFLRLSNVSGLALENEPSIIAEHRDILSALEARDGAKAEAAMKRHLQNIKDLLRRDWDELEHSRATTTP